MASVRTKSPPPQPVSPPPQAMHYPPPPPPPPVSHHYSDHYNNSYAHNGNNANANATSDGGRGGGPLPPPPIHQQNDDGAAAATGEAEAEADADMGARCCGFFMLCFATVGTTFAILCFRSCAFLSTTVPGNLLLPTSGPTVAFTLSPTTELPPFDDDTLGDDNNGTSSLFPSLLFPSYAPSLAPSSLVIPGQEEGADLVTLTFGLFVFLNITSNECVFYQYNSISDLSVYQNIGRLGITVAMICSLIAGTVLLLEYSFCRIPCSRVFINTGYALAICGVPLTFVVFLIDRCRQNNTSGGQDGCTMGRGGLYALIALIAFFITLVMTCVVPKSIPLVKVLQRWAVNDDTGGFGCLCWHRAGKGVWHFTGRLWWCGGCRRQQNIKGPKSPTGNADGGDDDEEGVPLAGGFSADDLVVDENGHTYKQYHDERAGYTLQNQYTGAYRRWLAFEEDYDVALARFKEACLEADVNWRVFLRKSKERRRRLRGQIQQQAQAQQQQALVVASPSGYPASVGAGSMTVATNPGASFYQLEEAAAAASAAASAADAESAIFPWNNDGGDDRTIATEGAFQDEQYGGDEDDIYLDDELLRNVDVLVTLQANCDFARDVMNRIQQDINDHARQEDVLHQQVLERQQLQKQKMEEKKRKKKKQEEEDKKAKAAAAASANANRWMTSRRTHQGQDNKEDDEGEASPFLDNTNRRTVASNRPDTPSSHPPPQIEYNEDPTADPTAAPPEGFQAEEDGDMYASARMMEATASRTTYRIDRDGDLFASARMEPRAPILPTSARSRLHGTIPTPTPTPSSGQPGEVTTPRDDEMSPDGGADGNGNNTVTKRVARPVAQFFKAVPTRANQAWDKVVTRRKDRSNDDDDDDHDDEDGTGIKKQNKD